MISGLFGSTPFVAVVGSIFVLFVTVFAPSWWSSVHRLPLPAGAEWIWGHEKTVFMNQAGHAFRKWINEVGLTFRIKAAFGAPDILVIADPVGIAHILQKKIYDYPHSSVSRPRIARLLGKGLGWVEGEGEHKRMRRLVNPSLSAENIKAMSPLVAEAAMTVIESLTQFVRDEGGRVEVNAIEWTGKAALNVIGRVAFLHDFEGGNSEEARQILQTKKEGASLVAQYASFSTLMLLRRFPLLNYVPLRAIQGQAVTKTTIQSGVAHEMIKRNQGLVSLDEKDLLSRLLSAAGPDAVSTSELYAQISTFIIAGFDSSNLTLGFVLWELARQPHIQEKLREEVTSLAREPTYEDIQSRLPYLEAVMKEAFRLYPGLPYMERTAATMDTIPLGTPVRLSNGKVVHEVDVKPGQTVIFPAIAIQRLNSVWGDGDTFRPERWLEELPSKDKLCSGWSNLLTFGDGPRNCIGWRLAVFQAKLILSALITRFRFEDTGMEMTLRVASSLQPWMRKSADEPALRQVPIIFHLL
ncbi:cytochrome P450 [Artomyces pyxidatus]|uniref:Cytochrome P450 n=1 Tax=Artomyces pyxidatus TaxID=48021 RepID=A0ACB8SQ63_9AGAM|nr:cytochrome P450 [Artomyces pyxidatus]